MSPSRWCPRPAHSHSHLAHSVRKPRRSNGPWGRGGGGVGTTPTSAQCSIGACLLEVASDPRSKSARPWGVPLRAGFRTPSPIFFCFVEPRDGVGGSETTRRSGARSAGMNRFLSRLSAPAYRLNNNPFSWPQHTKLYRLGRQMTFSKQLMCTLCSRSVSFHIRSVGFD